MELIKWTPDLSVGNEDIDGDHRRLFELLEMLHIDMRSGLVNQETQAIVDALIHYADTHFCREEVFMRSIDYPELGEHQAAHARFISELEALQSRIARGARTPVLDIDHFLTNWLRHHVLVMDKALAAALTTA
ncbi:MAG: bacteriohemerythrin [Rhodocyclaceae bacterium]